MWRKRLTRWKEALVAAAALSCAAAFPAAAAAGEEGLTLRVNDAAAEPGGLVAVVLRTYAPRGMERGEICVRARTRTKATATTPFADLESVLVFGDPADPAPTSTFDPPAQTALVEFVSPLAGVNQSDGPLAVFFFRLQSSLAAGAEFDLEIDLGATSLTGAGGVPITIEPRAGTLEVRPPGSPRLLAAEGDSVVPGDVAVLGVETLELFAVSRGQVVFYYDPAFAASPPVVEMNPRHGFVSFLGVTLFPETGEIKVEFESPDDSLNSVPGALVSILLPTAALPDGSQSVVFLDPDPDLTYLEDAQGQRIALELEAGVLDLGAGQIFADGFESGDVAAWSSSTSP